ncbi:dihydrofolate reductase [Gilvimarinus sp. SDUM040013]|uniref:Dihydrofolate reductase n=1 Tax=Gilvimarinus gilvus TaxID=3058038 RepID=A0ABU4RYC7_9GAMM|nr:dihydrofolate reductase [Gilvimarinus sp. SDUM040013]MDO3387420.1 dihydrofolate reductase [Gilvimarinus sp. SDUM040013]MDX6849897.1 dihydrofolate reductase [Gilvimarinus sp. SDUM040013]
MNIAMIVACGDANAIGKGNAMPWHLPADLQFFKRTTLGKPIIMGRKTFESIGKPLPGRLNIVISRNRQWQAPTGVAVAGSVDEAIDVARTRAPEGTAEVMVVGGEQIYRAALARADRVYKTEIDVTVEGADAFFPELPKSEWREVSRQSGEEDAPLSHRFLVLERNVKSDI